MCSDVERHDEGKIELKILKEVRRIVKRYLKFGIVHLTQRHVELCGLCGVLTLREWTREQFLKYDVGIPSVATSLFNCDTCLGCRIAMRASGQRPT